MIHSVTSTEPFSNWSKQLPREGVRVGDTVRVTYTYGPHNGESLDFTVMDVGAGAEFSLEIAGAGVSQQEMEKRFTSVATELVAALLETLGDTAVELGLTREIADAALWSVVLGALQMANEGGYEEMTKRVASAGGATEAALKVLEEGGFREMVKRHLVEQTRHMRG